MRSLSGVFVSILIPSVLAAQDARKDNKPATPESAAPKVVASSPANPALPHGIVVMPYVQPGKDRAFAGHETRRIHWFTEQSPVDFTVEFESEGGARRSAKPTRIALDFPALKPVKQPAKENKSKPAADKGRAKVAKEPDKANEKKEPKILPPPEVDQHYFKYTAILDNLTLGAAIHYRVRAGNELIREAVFRTSAPPDKSVRCVLVGDMAQGRPHQREIAYRISLQQPEFLVALGDIVYPTGRVNQYMHYYWGTYNNVSKASPESGASLMAGVTFYPVLGNHDIGAKLAKVPDALGAYYFFSPPKNGPGEGPWATPLDGTERAIADFRAATRDSYPYIDVYSFDNGPAHFVVINVNPKMDLNDPAFRKWLRDDLEAARDRWKFVCYHMPAFHSSRQHYPEQQARPLNPLLEEMGVTMTFAGHVHNYQRSLPLKFLPDDEQKNKGRVDGRFTLDTAFDGVTNTVPAGVIHIVAGGGGASLYGPGLDKTAEPLQKQFGDNYANFTAKTVVDQHSFVVLDLSPQRVDLRAISMGGEELDHISVTKAK
jgi:hypothetical protein